MALLRKRPGSPYWHLDWHEFPGDKGRRVVSTKIRHNNAKNPPKDGLAWDILRKKEDELARRAFGFVQPVKDIAIAPFLDEYLRWVAATRKDISRGTLIRNTSVFAAFSRWAEGERITRFADVTYATASQYLLHRSASKASKTLQIDCSTLALVWDEAKQRNHVAFTENPWRQVRPKKFTTVKRRALNGAEIAYLLAKLPTLKAWEHYVFYLALYTGARLTSIVLLPRSCVDFKQKLVSFPEEIVKEAPYTVPLHPKILAFLQSYIGGDATHFVPASEREKHTRYHYAQKALQDRLVDWRKDNTDKGKNPATEARLFKDISFHCLRHTFITALRESGASQSEAQLLAGHATASITEAYTHVAAQRLAPVIERLSFKE